MLQRLSHAGYVGDKSFHMTPLAQIIGDHPDVFVYLAFVLIEQVLLFYPGSYPYTLGIPVRIIPIDLKEDDAQGKLADALVRLSYKINEQRKEAYFINYLPMGVLGPRLFVGQVMLAGKGRIIIRAVPILSLGLAYGFLGAIGTLELSGFIFALLIAVLVYFFYRWLVSKLNLLL